jgi:hypothetical protein
LADKFHYGSKKKFPNQWSSYYDEPMNVYQKLLQDGKELTPTQKAHFFKLEQTRWERSAELNKLVSMNKEEFDKFMLNHENRKMLSDYNSVENSAFNPGGMTMVYDKETGNVYYTYRDGEARQSASDALQKSRDSFTNEDRALGHVNDASAKEVGGLPKGVSKKDLYTKTVQVDAKYGKGKIDVEKTFYKDPETGLEMEYKPRQYKQAQIPEKDFRTHEFADVNFRKYSPDDKTLITNQITKYLGLKHNVTPEWMAFSNHVMYESLRSAKRNDIHQQVITQHHTTQRV